MSSSKTIDERRQRRDKMQAGVNNIKIDLEARQRHIADFESNLLLLKNGNKASLFRLAKLKETTENMETLNVVFLLNRQTQSLIFSSNKRKTC